MGLNASLRTKGILTFSGLILYLALIGWFVAYQRQNLVEFVREIDANQANQRLLEPLVGGLAHAQYETEMLLNSAKFVDGHTMIYADLADHFDAIGARLDDAQKSHATLAPVVLDFRQAAALMRGTPSRQDLVQVRDLQRSVTTRLQEILGGLQQRSADLIQQYRDTQQYVGAFANYANIAGAVACVAVMLIFFTRLAKDIKLLQDRAVAIVAGYAGEPLANTRTDEIGGLIDAVNRMQVDLRQWEKGVEFNRQQRFHQEKMAAVGSLAAAIGHEVINPIAAISGVAEFIVEETRGDDRPSGKTIGEFAAQILKQTERITLIMRQMATLTAPSSPKRELLDLNAQIRATWGFLAYDKRLRGIRFEADLSSDIPAVTGVADHITQILMNLLINAADAMDHISEPDRRTIRIATRAVDGEIQVSITDNGRGMSPDILTKAFDDSFTTKPAGKGRGIGLFVCRTLIEEAGGRITLVSTPNVGTTATFYLPSRPTPAQPA